MFLGLYYFCQPQSYRQSYRRIYAFILGCLLSLLIPPLYALTNETLPLKNSTYAGCGIPQSEEPPTNRRVKEQQISTAKRNIVVGILAPYGEQVAEKEWCPWITALNDALPMLHFILKPLQIHNIEREVASGDLDLLLSHQGTFINLDAQYPIRAMASLKKNVHLEDDTPKIGSAIWVRQESPIHTLSDLKNRTVHAVSPQALGGFLLAYYEIMQYDPTLQRSIDFQYHGFPIERLFQYLTDDKPDSKQTAIIVPACLYERLERQGLLPTAQLRLIHPITLPDFPCQTSSELMPSWSLGALSSLDDTTAKMIQATLFNLKSPNLPIWQLPYTLTDITQLTYELKRFENHETLWDTLIRLADTYKIWLFLLIIVLLMLLVNHLWLSYAVTKRGKALEQAYQQMHHYEAMLSKADRMNILGEMASGIGHELKQPLSTIRNYAEGSMLILQKEPDESQARSLLLPLQKISEQVTQCHHIINNLRTWAKPKAEITQETIILKHFLEQIIEITRLRVQDKAEISIDVPEHFTINSTPSILEQVIANCLMNSAQAGATELAIRLKIYPNYIKLFISDNGPGFTAEELSSPFVPFRTSKQDGLGLGLVICQRLIENLNGKMRIANRKDGHQGAVVRLILPRS
ncbi:sensor histidine kinase [Ignatzschineria ureiclastica]|uniref:histidine kinase n=1 Tax=Ignatzschineria ureiclastica TaxID=472582 RepID=A0A2U2AG66_9GAMM|nr:sensor histidine kinase [Ignatzschineria ureiclastica]PWD81651.1 sensor histidine kinase [Ignatzschineria ureiclastica]